MGPQIPNEMAAMAGANTDPARALTVWVTATRPNDENSGSNRQLPVTSRAAITTTARLPRARSMSAPAGVWASSAATPARVITRPMLAGCHWCTASR
ncbi:hypothetical protein D3C78_1501740 [compost metagenome]